MTNHCPKCGAAWPRALRRPFKAISCIHCEVIKRGRQDIAHDRRLATLKRESDATVAKFNAMIPEERVKLYTKLDATWGT